MNIDAKGREAVGKVLRAWQKTVEAKMKVRHRDGGPGVVLSKSSHSMYDFDVSFPDGISPCYLANLLPEWWPLDLVPVR